MCCLWEASGQPSSAAAFWAAAALVLQALRPWVPDLGGGTQPPPFCSQWQLGHTHVATASDLSSLLVAATGGMQRCSGGTRVPCGAPCPPGTVEPGLSDGQPSGSSSRGWAHPRQATAVAGGVKACRIGLDSVSHGSERSATAGGRLPLLQLQRQRSTRGRPSVGATRRQTAPLTAPGLSKVQRPCALLPGWGVYLRGEGRAGWSQRQRQAAVPPCSCPFCRHSSFRKRSPLGGHIQCPACLSLSCHQCASRPLFILLACLCVFSPCGWPRGPRLGTCDLGF